MLSSVTTKITQARGAAVICPGHCLNYNLFGPADFRHLGRAGVAFEFLTQTLTGTSDAVLKANKEAIENITPTAAKRVCFAFPAQVDKSSWQREYIYMASAKALQIPSVSHVAITRFNVPDSAGMKSSARGSPSLRGGDEGDQAYVSSPPPKGRCGSNEGPDQVSKFWHDGLGGHVHVSYRAQKP
jgi:hypothetical protein